MFTFTYDVSKSQLRDAVNLIAAFRMIYPGEWTRRGDQIIGRVGTEMARELRKLNSFKEVK